MTVPRSVETQTWLAGWDPSSSLDLEQRQLLEDYVDMLSSFNRRLNLVSRESCGDIWMRHVVHSLFLSGRPFPDGSVVVDWGTGGGLPLIPLAVCFPQVHFIGVEAIEKKAMAVKTMLRRLGLSNSEIWTGRAEKWQGRTDYSVSRATASLSVLWAWHERVAVRDNKTSARQTGQPHAVAVGRDSKSDHGNATEDVRRNTPWEPGLICLKGGDLSEERRRLESTWPDARAVEMPLDSTVCDGQFAAKAIVTVRSSYLDENRQRVAG